MSPAALGRALRRFAGAASLVLAVAVAAAGAQPAALDVNTATQAQLEQLRGIGVAMSDKLLAERARQPFADWADLIARVPGVSARSAARLSEQGLRVGAQAYEKPPR
jgi:competence protein ComEA